MTRFRTILMSSAVALSLATSLATARAGGSGGDGQEGDHHGRYSHVLLISVDGMHAADLAKYVADPSHSGSTLSALAAKGVVYPKALTTAPSDSFPGIVAQATGGTSKSTGVFYDDSFDRTYFAPGSDCSGPAGAEVRYFEYIDKDSSRLDAGGTIGDPLSQIDPAKLPRALVNGTCTSMLPHTFVRVNTIFEVIKQHGMRTAWSDKHPAYEILSGPSGQGIDDLYTPEINSDISGYPGSDNTTAFAAVRDYDENKVQAVIRQIEGLTSTGKLAPSVPAILGMNFQAVSVGQKLAKSGPTDPSGLTGGYLDANATPGNALAIQLDYVDHAIGRMVAALQQQGLSENTLIIISAKHGQSPIDPTLRRAVDDGPYPNTPSYAFHVGDDVALLWITPPTQSAELTAAQAYLDSQFGPLAIARLLGPDQLARLYRDPRTDSRTPDFISIVEHGVIYTSGTKLAEHGGFLRDDRNVALIVSSPRLEAAVVDEKVETRQIAPTILEALGLNPEELRAVHIEQTQALPGLDE